MKINMTKGRTTTHVVRGMETDMDRICEREITVRITSDQYGKSISLSNEEDRLLMIPLEPIIPRLKEILK